MAQHRRAYRTPVAIAMSVAAATTVVTALALSGSAGAADDPGTPLGCPNGFLPAIGQADPQSTLCVTVGPDKAGNIHAIVRIDPALCAHVVVGDNRNPVSTDPNERRDVVRTLRCPRVVPVTPPDANVPAPVPAPATEAPSTPAPSQTLPEAPVPPVQSATLPVTH